MSDIFRYDSPMQSPGFKFWQKFIRWQHQIDIALAPLNLTQPTFSILAIIGWLSKNNSVTPNNYVRQKIIVDMSGMQKMQISLILQRLSKKKLIRILPYPLDLREKQIELTPEGANILKKSIVLVENIDTRFLVDEIDSN